MDTKDNEEDLQRTTSLLNSVIPIFDMLLQALEENQGWFPEHDKIIAFLSRLKNPWCLYYENENSLRILAKRACFLDDADEDTINSLLEDATAVLNLSDSDFSDFQKEVSLKAQDNKVVSIEDQHQKLQDGLTYIYALITHLFDFLALMIHGRSMCQLVNDAKNGDDNAYRLAVHIDRTVLQIPYFQQRLLRSQFSNDQDFLDGLAASIQTPILQSKIKYRTLRLVFSMLDDTNFLDSYTPSKLLELCEKLKVTGGSDGINDVKKLKYQLKEYKKNKKTRK